MRVSLQALPERALLNMIVQPVWDSVLIGTSNSGDVRLFTSIQGKTLVDTNMVQPAMFPDPDEFYVRGFMLNLVPRNQSQSNLPSMNDLLDFNAFLDKCIFSFQIGSNARKVVEGHASLFPAGLGLAGYATAGGGATFTHILGNGVKELDNRFALGDTFTEKLKSNEQFKGVLSFPAGTLTISNSFTCRAYLPGLWGQSVG